MLREKVVIAWLAYGVAWAWVVTQALLPGGILNLDLLLMFANGFITALYLGALIGLRGGQRNVAFALGAAALGVTHFLWAPLVGMALSAAAVAISPFHQVSTQNASMFAATGLVFGALLCGARLSRVSAIGVLVATGLSVTLVLGQLFVEHVLTGLGLHFHEIGLWAAPLHIGIGSVALADTLTVIRAERRHSRPICARCGYDITGLPSRMPCPECGAPAAG